MKKIVTVYPWPMHPKVAQVLNSIEGVNLVEALPGGPGPVLAIKSAPPFACDAIVVTSPQKALQALDIITETGIKLVTMGQWLGGNEVASEKVEAKVKFK